MMDILYTIFIFPVEQIIELSYVFVFRIFKNPALSVLGVSFAVSLFTLPLYFMAEKHQRSERDIQKRMKPEIDNIKFVFSGDERFMLLSTYYRQNGYHPLYSLRSSISLIIQIPFFIAAYHFLSNLEIIRGISFGPVKNLAEADSLFHIGNFAINILPILMTLINCISSFIYTKGLSSKEKIQLYGMAAIFLALLYNSPSGMVLYWTGNNLFSLIKNIIQKTKQPKIVTLFIIAASCLILDIYILFFHEGWIIKRLFLAFVVIIIPFLPLLFKFFFRKKLPLYVSEVSSSAAEPKDSKSRLLFILSAIVLFLFAGLLIPSSLIASSVQEFSFIENYNSPFSYIFNTLLQSFGLFIVWPLCIYNMLSKKTKHILAKIAVILVFMTIINVVLFPGKYGYLSLMFYFSEDVISGGITNFLNIFAILIAGILPLFFIKRYKNIFVSAMIISVSALLFAGIANNINIYNKFKSYKIQLSKNEIVAGEPVFQFSKTGKNILVMMLDRAQSGFIPYVFEEKPELYNSFDGFTWYKNAISFGGSTLFGVPCVFGGYEYAPLETQARSDTPLVKKHNEALLLLPKIFLENDFKVTVTDPPYANYSVTPDLSIFDDYPDIDAKNIIGNYNSLWLSDETKLSSDGINLNLTEVPGLIKNYLIRFSLFKFAPLIFRNFIYDHGQWLSTMENKFSQSTLDNYIALDILPDITAICDNNINTYISLSNILPHEPNNFFHTPVIISNEITNMKDNPFTNNKHYHVNKLSLILVGKWLDFLRENGVYDNTRIIIVSDHGINLNNIIPDNIILPNGDNLEAYFAFLMVKDFNSHGILTVDNSFMTNADTPLIALDGIIDNPINPSTGKSLTSNKADGITITTSKLWEIHKHHKNIYNIKPDEWLHVHTNIYSQTNWNTIIE